jgi:hypothetical protein
MKKTISFGIFSGDLNDPIFLARAAAYDAIFEKNICHGVSGNPAQKKIVMLGGISRSLSSWRTLTAKS